MEWPLRVLLMVGGMVLATPGGGIMPLSEMQMVGFGLALLVPAVLIARCWCAALRPSSTGGGS